MGRRPKEETPHKRPKALTRRTALTGGAAGLATSILNACGGGEKTSAARDDLDGRAAAGTPAAGIFELEEAQVRLRQPRDDEPVLRPDALRRRGRVQAAGLLLPVDGLGEHNVNEMVNAFNTAITGDADGIAVASSTPRRSTARPTRRSRRRSPSSPTTPTRPRTRAWPTSARTCSSPARRWASTSPSSSVGRRGAVHRHAGPGQHPAAHRRRQGHAEVKVRPSSRT